MSSEPQTLDPADLPTHVAIIMDGNGRWAKGRGMPRIEGHRRGVENVRRIVDESARLGIRYVTLYAFSCENWSRPDDEVRALMSLLERFLKRYTKELIDNRVRLHTIGDLSQLPAKAQKAVAESKERTAHFDDHNLILALNYGARQELMRALTRWNTACEEGRSQADAPRWEDFAGCLDTAGIPDPDLLIRTSGEARLSNFLLLQCAYSEFYFTPLCWPEFGPEQLREALHAYSRRERRFGRTGEQLTEAK